MDGRGRRRRRTFSRSTPKLRLCEQSQVVGGYIVDGQVQGKVLRRSDGLGDEDLLSYAQTWQPSEGLALLEEA